MCGCGSPAPIARATQASAGHVKGHPVRFLPNHHKRIAFDARYVVEDGGYETPCWIWTGYLNEDGYGFYRHRGAHVVAYELVHGPIPRGCEIDHLCRVRCCVNAEHLEAVSHLENVRRGDKRKLTDEALGEILSRRGEVSLRRELAERFGVHPEYVGQLWRQADRLAV